MRIRDGVALVRLAEVCAGVPLRLFFPWHLAAVTVEYGGAKGRGQMRLRACVRVFDFASRPAGQSRNSSRSPCRGQRHALYCTWKHYTDRGRVPVLCARVTPSAKAGERSTVDAKKKKERTPFNQLYFTCPFGAKGRCRGTLRPALLCGSYIAAPLAAAPPPPQVASAHRTALADSSDPLPAAAATAEATAASSAKRRKSESTMLVMSSRLTPAGGAGGAATAVAECEAAAATMVELLALIVALPACLTPHAWNSGQARRNAAIQKARDDAASSWAPQIGRAHV